MPEDLTLIFEQIKSALARYAPLLTVKTETAKSYHLYSEKKIELAGRQLTELYFAGLIIQITL